MKDKTMQKSLGLCVCDKDRSEKAHNATVQRAKETLDTVVEYVAVWTLRAS